MDDFFLSSTFFKNSMKLVFATNNLHKLEEVQHLLGDKVNVLSLKDISFFDEIPEDYDTLKENALQKAQYIYDRYKTNCFADDTGLEIDFLKGAPGVYSARYAGENCTFDDNINKVLRELGDAENRKARFRTVVALIMDGEVNYFEGIVDGEILMDRQGGEGFGYDPVFRPLGFEESFAQMDLYEKNKISHRGRATKKLVDFLLSK